MLFRVSRETKAVFICFTWNNEEKKVFHMKHYVYFDRKMEVYQGK